jgi:hypothetical protein
MRFLSSIAGYRFVAIHDEVNFDTDGYTRTTKPGYAVQFRKGILTDYEKAIAREKLTFRGVPMNMDGSAIDPVSRASLFDTEWIEDKELRARVEKRMLEHSGLNHYMGYILVEEEKVPAPWPTYDELTIHGRRNVEQVARKNVEVARLTGVPIEALIAYEKQNRNDERLIGFYNAALVEASAEEPSEELVEA